ncbi:hypothetical protein F0562_018733 [Nyssa sinensis]|uniref:Uncharacterized protein n=1 Tax=Nyssa sinensis TaxID=561372 RepID=A0A5J4ZD42_9ASTE|nr:hypothetical protein F0562_018733 [Nyssa sinensis]
MGKRVNDNKGEGHATRPNLFKGIHMDPNGSDPKTPARKAAPWAKVPFEKRYSQMDWLKLTQTHPDLAGPLVLPHTFTFKTLFQTLDGPCAVFKVSGLKGQSNRRLISLNEVKTTNRRIHVDCS